MKAITRHIGVASLLTLFLGACGAPDPSQDSSTDDTQGSGAQNGADLSSTQQAVYNGWTAYTSEEYAPVVCDSAALVNRAQCRGRYCDDIRAYCQPTAGTVGASYWTTYFSEEGTDYRYCNAGYWVTGFSCSGDYCDNISLQCTYIYGISAKNCYWTGWHSEEGGGTLAFGNQYYARGAQCDGSNCDNKRYYVCQP
jgi:hypothetical protein